MTDIYLTISFFYTQRDDTPQNDLLSNVAESSRVYWI